MAGLVRKLFSWGVVQSAERVAVNHEVAGSSPAAPAPLIKGEEMSTKETKELKKEVTTLRVRINELIDEVSVLKNEVRRFKENFASDVKYLTERIDG